MKTKFINLLLLIFYNNVQDFCYLAMTPPLSHEEFRSRVCGLCWLSKKNSVRKITPDLQQKIRLYQYAEYDILNEALPTVICTSCRMQLLRCEKVDSL